ncbi:GntR family transcriptional regulator [Aestuariivirga sp.]|uniref:GntR family transcriptional regulator n=1 Tax=Aestuariivirga sp. TaxID=2650926 RepID=UPI0039E312D0
MSVATVTYDFLDAAPVLQRGGATQRVQAALRDAIVRLELKPGSLLDKHAIAQRMGVSRFPVGEALGRLAAEGLVEIMPQSGSRVALIRLSDARENMFLRRAIETEALRALTHTLDPSAISAMKQAVLYQEAAAKSDDRDGFYRFDVDFHEVLLDALGFQRVRAAAQSARLGLERVRRLLNTRRAPHFTLDEHRRILDAITARDGDAAAKAMEDHLAAVMTELELLARERPDLFADLTATGDVS